MTIIKNLVWFHFFVIIFIMILFAVIVTHCIPWKMTIKENKLFKANKVLINIIDNLLRTGNLY